MSDATTNVPAPVIKSKKVIKVGLERIQGTSTQITSSNKPRPNKVLPDITPRKFTPAVTVTKEEAGAFTKQWVDKKEDAKFTVYVTVQDHLKLDTNPHKRDFNPIVTLSDVTTLKGIKIIGTVDALNTHEALEEADALYYHVYGPGKDKSLLN
jgi:hypothetical protein